MDKMISMAIYLAAGLILVAGAVFGGQKVLSNSKASNAASDLTAFEQAVKGQYSVQPSFSNITLTAANAGGWTPADWVSGTNSAVDQWGGSVTLAAVAAGTQFSITLNDVPNVACGTLANAAADAQSVAVNGTALVGTNPSNTNVAPFDPAAIATSCAGSNTMVFVFGH